MPKNNDYWKKRESEHLKLMQKDEKVLIKRLESLYQTALKDIQNEINQFYMNYASKEKISMSDAIKKVNIHDVKAFSDKAKKYVKDRDFSPTANRELRLYNLTMKVSRLELLKAQINLELLNMANATEKEIAKYLSSVTLAEYERQSGILGQTLDNNVDHIKNIVNASYLNATFSERIWQNLDELRSTLTTTIKKSILQGKNPKTFASELMKRFDVSRANAESILLTETARIQAEVQTDSFMRAGYERYEYLAETGACHKCASLDGKIFKLSEASYGINLYPMHPHCRCSTVPDYKKK
ncbi:minor capsid protein [Carnobacterium maltaromaticum]|uniref:minor capsid protein n=1 Tax=Carnobacterium maltaromaticum TaxID=2751 RepID=UPI0039BDB09B